MSINGNLVDMSSSQVCRKKTLVLAVVLPVDVTFEQSWGTQPMKAGSIALIDPSTSTVTGCQTGTFAITYDPAEDQPGFFRKKALIRAMRMDEPFEVTSLDNLDEPESGNPGDYLVENIREDEVQDRYLIRFEEFEPRYEPVEAEFS